MIMWKCSHAVRIFNDEDIAADKFSFCVFVALQ